MKKGLFGVIWAGKLMWLGNVCVRKLTPFENSLNCYQNAFDQSINRMPTAFRNNSMKQSSKLKITKDSIAAENEFTFSRTTQSHSEKKCK